jgi:hypothetical protein
MAISSVERDEALSPGYFLVAFAEIAVRSDPAAMGINLMVLASHLGEREATPSRI